MAGVTPFIEPSAEREYITRKATELGLDPQAVLAVAAHEGVSIPAQVGDQGTSFGPWQLHAGGALPASVWQQGPEYANAWANSQAGIDYALNAIATVAKGQRGPTAVRSIVYGFEHPADPAGETARSIATYNQGGQPGLSTSGPGNPIGGGGISSATPGVGAVLSAADSVPKFLRFVTSWRFAEIVGGFLLLIVGLVLLGRQLGVNVPAPGPFGRSASRAQAGADSTFAFEPGEQAHRARQASRRTSRQGSTSGGRKLHTLPADRPASPPRAAASAGGDEVPF